MIADKLREDRKDFVPQIEPGHIKQQPF